jgi:uncharacterized membrane protein
VGKRWVFWALLIGIVLWFVVPAIADTGGSMGGGDWGGGGGGGGGGYSGGGGGYSGGGGGGYDSGGGWSSGGGSGGGQMSGATFVFLLIVFVIIIVAKVVMSSGSSFSSGGNYDYMPAYEPANTADVTVLRVAIDGRARKFVQKELSRIAQVANTKTKEGRAAMLREVTVLVRKLRDAWVYGGAINEPMRVIGSAKSVFDQHVDDARSKFQEETIRNTQGQITTRAASEYTARSDEGEGLILVTIIIAARLELFTVRNIGNGEDLRNALESASQILPGNLIALEIVWQPSEETDRLSSMELEAKYPKPEIIPIFGALVGKVFCDYCSGPFPAELVSCPHCGAPAPGRTKEAA